MDRPAPLAAKRSRVAMKAPHHTTTLQGFLRAHFSHVCLWIAMGSRRVSFAVLPICNTPPSGARHHVNRGSRCHTRSRGRMEKTPAHGSLCRRGRQQRRCLAVSPTAARLPAAPRARGNSHNRGEKPTSLQGEPPATCAFSRVNWRPSYRPWLMPGLRPGGLSAGCDVLVSSICSNTRMTWRELSTMAKSSGIQLGKVRRAPGHVSSCLPHSERDSKTRISAPWRAPSDWRSVPIRVIDGAMNSAFAFSRSLKAARGGHRPHGLG